MITINMNASTPNNPTTHKQSPQYYQHIPVQVNTAEQHTVRISISQHALHTAPLLGQIYMLIPIGDIQYSVGIPCILTSHYNEINTLNFVTHKDEIQRRQYTIPNLLRMNLCNMWGPLSRPFDTKKLHGKTMWYIATQDRYLVPALHQHNDKEHPHTPIILNEETPHNAVLNAINTHMPHTLFISASYMPYLKGIQHIHNMEIYSVHALSNIICGLGACRCCVEIFDDKAHAICQRGPVIKRQSHES